MPTFAPQDFVSKWKRVTSREKQTVTSDEKKKRTLTNLYNARPTWLNLAHKRLNEAVFAAYGWKGDLSDEKILEKLLSLNLERGKPRRQSPGVLTVSKEEDSLARLAKEII